MGINTTYVNRAHTNEFVLRKTNEAVEFFSDMLQDRRIKLAGHIVRSAVVIIGIHSEKVSYQPDPTETYNVGKRRVRGP